MSYGSEELIRLSAQADTVDLRKIGLLSVTKPKYISGKQMASYCRTVAAQALIDNIQNSLSGLLLRNAIPEWDFLDGYAQKIKRRIWSQPANGVEYDQSDYENYPIYLTGSESRNDRKAIFIYGILNMKPDEPVYATKMRFWKSSVRNLEVVDLTPIKHYNNILFLQMPVLYGRGDDAEIRVDLGPDATGHNDNLAILGIVAESLGYHYGG